jgi:hypothetical protein
LMHNVWWLLNVIPKPIGYCIQLTMTMTNIRHGPLESGPGGRPSYWKYDSCSRRHNMSLMKYRTWCGIVDWLWIMQRDCPWGVGYQLNLRHLS